MINLPIQLKTAVPGYRRKWYNRSKAMIETIEQIIDHLTFGEDEDGPWLETYESDFRMHGFWASSERETHQILKPKLPLKLEERYMRIIIDYMSRFMYPHMRPDLKLTGYEADQMFGFHGHPLCQDSCPVS